MHHRLLDVFESRVKLELALRFATVQSGLRWTLPHTRISVRLVPLLYRRGLCRGIYQTYTVASLMSIKRGSLAGCKRVRALGALYGGKWTRLHGTLCAWLLCRLLLDLLWLLKMGISQRNLQKLAWWLYLYRGITLTRRGFSYSFHGFLGCFDCVEPLDFWRILDQVIACSKYVN